jgi:acyl dehydratase
MPDWVQRYWEDVHEGDELPTLEFPITIARLIIEAAANRDFWPLHHSSEFARASGAADMYANNIFLQGMWERSAREYIGLAGVLKKLGPFRMRSFNVVGETVVVKGAVRRTWQSEGENFVEIELRSENSSGVLTVAPGPVLATLPSRASNQPFKK